MADDNDQENGIDDDPVERRAVPRAPLGGLEVEILQEDGSWALVSSEELSVESLFIKGGEQTTGLELNQKLQIRLRYQDDQVEAEARCVRKERIPRTGVVLCLEPGERPAQMLLASVLEPSRVPPGVD